MTLDLENFEGVRLRGEELYRTFSATHCPYLGEKVLFNAQGMEHVRFKQQRKARPQQDQYMRLKLLHLAPIVIKSSSTLQGVWETKIFEKVRMHSRTDTVLKNVFYEFVAVIERVRVKVIVKRIVGSCPIFWSIIPYWGVDRNTQKKESCIAAILWKIRCKKSATRRIFCGCLVTAYV